MTTNMLVVDQHAVGILDAALIEDSWFQHFNVPANAERLRRTVVGNAIYLLSSQADLDSGLLVVQIGPSGVFSGAPKPRSVFERILRVALRHFNRNIILPVQWQTYHEGALVSVYAEPFARQSQSRIYFDQAPAGDNNIFAFAVTDSPQVMKQVPINLESYKVAVAGLLDALIHEPPAQEPVGNFGILLSAQFGTQLASSGTLEEWYERKLTTEQLHFVDQQHNQPVRLRGVAGTGKTQAMAVKCLRDLYQDAKDRGNKKTIAFLTHSSALAHDVVRGMFCALDPSERWTHLHTSSERPKLWIGTLYELAQEHLGYEKKGLKPLSLDGREGRELQRLLIQDAIEIVRKDPRCALGVLRDCPDFAERLSDENSRQSLIEELMNEFACVLDAENIRKGTEEAARYVLAPREPWQMQLPTVAHRNATIEIHDEYRKLLSNERFLSMDQMIADFGRYLPTHEWTQLRERDGFDLIFVDEYHYFTRVEVMTLQPLFAPRAAVDGRWPLIMAYDLKQSTSDAPLGGALERFRNPRVGKSVPVDLTQVFRSTPQIAAFLSDLDASFPAIGLDGVFDPYAGHSNQDDGDVPALLEFRTDIKLIDGVLDRANRIARGLPHGGRQVAVLCLNEERFDRHRNAGRNDRKFVPVTSREDLRELRFAKMKCVFSMPEYVAGLEFDTVFLIHADRVDFENEYLSLGARRRYVSRAYLGASRAAQRLVIASSAARGGPSTILDCPLKTGSLKRIGV